MAREEECAGAFHTAHDYGNFVNFVGAGKDTLPVLGRVLVYVRVCVHVHLLHIQAQPLSSLH